MRPYVGAAKWRNCWVGSWEGSLVSLEGRLLARDCSGRRAFCSAWAAERAGVLFLRFRPSHAVLREAKVRRIYASLPAYQPTSLPAYEPTSLREAPLHRCTAAPLRRQWPAHVARSPRHAPSALDLELHLFSAAAIERLECN